MFGPFFMNSGFSNWPYADFQDLNLDWILKKLKWLEEHKGELDNGEIQQEIVNLYNRENAKDVQMRVRREGTSNLPLDLVSGVTRYDKLNPNSTVPTNTVFYPRALYSWDRREMMIMGVMQFADQIQCGYQDYTTILTGLPTIFTSVILYNELMIFDDTGSLIHILPARYSTEHFTRVATAFNMPANPSEGDSVYIEENGEWMLYENGHWVHKYKPCGVLQIAVPLWYATGDLQFNAGDKIYICGRPIRLLTSYGAITFPRITDIDNRRACEWIKANRGCFNYSNNSIKRRKEPNPYGATDCSGMIHQAFRYGAGKFVPDGTKTDIGYGKIIDFYPAGMPLDTSKLKEGDIVGYIFADRESRIFSCHHVAIAVRGFADDPNDNVLRLWHESTGYGCYEHQGDAIDNPIPSYQQYVHDGVVFGPQPVAGTYRQTGKTYTDATYRMATDARIIVRWSEDSTALRNPGHISDLSEDFETGGEGDNSED